MQQQKTDWNNLFLFLSLGILFYLYLTYSNIQQTPSQDVLAKDSISTNEQNQTNYKSVKIIAEDTVMIDVNSSTWK